MHLGTYIYTCQLQKVTLSFDFFLGYSSWLGSNSELLFLEH